jgi:hypothetical protein
MLKRADHRQPGVMTSTPNAVPTPSRLARRTLLATAIAGAVGITAGHAAPAAAAPRQSSTSGLRGLRRTLQRRLRYLDRAGWEANESYRFASDGSEIFPPAYFDVQTLTVHHTVTANADANPAGTVRAIYFDQAVTQDFGDIGYHLLIDQAGTVYEGRHSGSDSVPVFGPRRVGPRPSMVNAAHVGGFNAGNVGIALLGDFTTTNPTAAARGSLVHVLAALADACDLEPLGTTNYVNPISGATRTVNTIAGHREWAPTQCPGNTFYPFLAEIRREVAELLDS